MSWIQNFFMFILPKKWSESMKQESCSWMFQCTCGFERSFWDAGCIRWKAAGRPKRLMRCPQCNQVTWQTVYKK